MNYFSHGHKFINNPYLLAGTAVPDWLCVADRRVRTRPDRALELVNDANPHVAAVARGIVQHHHDDAWFHDTHAFNQSTFEVSVLCRNALPEEEGYRPSFLGHILVEMLLDAALIVADHAQLAAYYAAMQRVDPEIVQRVVNATSRNSTDQLAWFIQRFCEVRFLYDYADNAKLLFRLNQVMRRVRLSPLPDKFADVIGTARQIVATRAHELLAEQPPRQRAAS